MHERFRLLFSRYLNNTCSSDEMNELFELLGDPRHEAELRSMMKELYNSTPGTHIQMPFVDEKGRLVLDGGMDQSRVVEKNSKKHRRRIAFAASMIAICVTVAVALNNQSSPHEYVASALSSKTTGNTENIYIVLEDSTQVWLNATSSLKYPQHFDAGERVVYLEGEAFFEVKHADSIPFIIHTGNISTRVLGTAFNVKAYPGQKAIEVSVSRGKVQVSRDNNIVATLIKGEQVRIGDAADIQERRVQPARVAAWKEGNIEFVDESFGDIVADLERIYQVKIVITGRDIAGLQISTSFRKNIGIDEALKILTRLTDTEVLKDENRFIIK